MLVSWNFLIFCRPPKPTSQEIIQNGLQTYFHVVRIMLLQRNHLATRRVIQQGCWDYIPEIRFFNEFDDGIISGKGLDGTVLHVFGLCRFKCSTRWFPCGRFLLVRVEILSICGKHLFEICCVIILFLFLAMLVNQDHRNLFINGLFTYFRTTRNIPQ